MIDIEDDDTGVARGADTARPQRTAAAILGSGVKILERPAMELALGAQNLAARTVGEIMQGIELEPSRGNDFARRWFGLGWNDPLDLAILQGPEDLGVGVASIHRRDRDGPAGCRGNRIEPSRHRHALVLLARRDFDIDNDAGHIVDGCMLLVGRFEPAVPAIGRHRGVGIRYAHLLEFATLSALAKGVVVAFGLRDSFDMAYGECIPTDMGADQRGIEMDDFAGCDPRCNAGLDRALEDPVEALGTPALANARQ